MSEMSLHFACDLGKTHAAIALIERGANVNEKNTCGMTPLNCACRSGHTALAMALIEKGANMDEKNQTGKTSLYLACQRHKTATAVALIERGAKVNEKDQLGTSPLHGVCMDGGRAGAATAVALIERGARVNEKNKYGETPLYYACYRGYSAAAIALLNNGAVCVNDGDTRTLPSCYPHGSTTSYFACRKCTTDVVLRVIQIGAILTAADLQSLRDQPTVTEEQACTVEDAYKREVNWRRRAQYVMFLSSIRDLVDVEHEPRPSAAANSDSGGIGRRTRAATNQARLMRAVDKVLCRTDMQRLISSFL
jgi:hypothetical protein